MGKNINSVVIVEKGKDGSYNPVSTFPIKEQTKEAVRDRLPHQLGEITIDTSKRDELPHILQSHFPDHLKGNGNGIFTMPVYAFGRGPGDNLNAFYIALHKNEDGSLKQIFEVDHRKLENYKTLHEFYQI